MRTTLSPEPYLALPSLIPVPTNDLSHRCVVADPTALMDSDVQDIFAINYEGNYNTSFALTYNDYGNTFYLSATKQYWDGMFSPSSSPMLGAIANADS